MLHVSHPYQHASEIIEIHGARLRAWAADNPSDKFTEDEMRLFRSVALAYADPRRPSMHDLYGALCAMIDSDHRHSGSATQLPSASAFHRLVPSLPTEFVNQQRYGHRISPFEIIRSAEPILAAIEVA